MDTASGCKKFVLRAHIHVALCVEGEVRRDRVPSLRITESRPARRSTLTKSTKSAIPDCGLPRRRSAKGSHTLRHSPRSSSSMDFLSSRPVTSARPSFRLALKGDNRERAGRLKEAPQVESEGLCLEVMALGGAFKIVPATNWQRQRQRTWSRRSQDSRHCHRIGGQATRSQRCRYAPSALGLD
jgi:hypothetical protein